MSLPCAKGTASLIACRSGADRVVVLVLALVVLPSPAFAQRDAFFSGVVSFYRSLSGLYGDEGPQLVTQLEAMASALERWDVEIRDAERELRPRLETGADLQTRLQVHTLLASLYLERGRLADAAREFDDDIALDPTRAAFHRLKGLVLQAMPPEARGEGPGSRAAAAADAFRTAWLLEPADPLHAYRLIAERAAQTTPAEIEQALDTLATLEDGLIRRERPGVPAPFPNIGGIIDDAAGATAFVPTAYAGGFTLILQGELDRGLAALRAALAADPLVIDASLRSDPVVRGISALRQGQVAAAVAQLDAAVAGGLDSPEVRRILATAHSVTGDVARSVQHLREGLRRNPRDERSWLLLARTLDDAGRLAEAEKVLREAVAELPGASVVRWRLSTTLEKLQRADDSDRDLLGLADRFVLLVGRGELYRALARLAEQHLDYERTIELLRRGVSMTPNHAAGHRALGRAYLENGRDAEGYGELVIALLLAPEDVETLTALGRRHLTAGRADRAVEALARAVDADPADRLAVHAYAEALNRAGRSVEGKQLVEEAERLLARAIEGDRRARTAAALRLDAEVRAAARDYPAAIDLWRQAMSLQPGGSAAHVRLAEALAAAGRADEALAEYRTALSRGAGADIHLRLADLYERIGRSDEASRERTRHVERRLDELHQRAEAGTFGS